MKIPVMEVFGPTIQGEGMVMGQKTMFVRTAGCDYSCSWCDSSFTWDGTGQSTLKQPSEIIEELQAIGGQSFSHVTISGGNPALHKGIGELVDLCHAQGWKVAVETQATFWQDWLLKIDDITLIPETTEFRNGNRFRQTGCIHGKAGRFECQFENRHFR